MKNLDMKTINNYNDLIVASSYTGIKPQETTEISHFLEGTRIHLTYDRRDMKNQGKNVRIARLRETEHLIEVVCSLQGKLQQNQPFSSEDTGLFLTLNRYNDGKNRQTKIIAVMSVILTIVAVVFSIAKYI